MVAVEAKDLHLWRVSTAEAMDIQRRLASQVVPEGSLGDVQYVAGADISVNTAERTGKGAVVVLSYPDLRPVEQSVAEVPLTFPYVPGLLSFREMPVLIEAFAKLSLRPDLLLADAQGLAHPRRFGLACHLGLLYDIPTIGCAKSRLCGEHDEVGPERGSRTALRDGAEVIGAVVRTRDDVKPLYISIGHRIGLEEAVEWVLRCCRGYRLPEPTRLAHLAAAGEVVASGADPQARQLSLLDG
jgi:deoxyribonuclease V